MSLPIFYLTFLEFYSIIYIESKGKELIKMTPKEAFERVSSMMDDLYGSGYLSDEELWYYEEAEKVLFMHIVKEELK